MKTTRDLDQVKIRNLRQNSAERTPCILVVDISGSMDEQIAGASHRRIDELNNGLQALHQSLLKDDDAVNRVEIAIVTVGGSSNEATLIQDFSTVNSFSIPVFTAEGGTPLGEGVRTALDALDSRCRLLDDFGRTISRPWMFVLSDGEPTDSGASWKDAVERARRAEAANRCLIYPLLIEGADNSKLQELSANPVRQLAAARFVEFFVWVSRAVSRPIRSDSDASTVEQFSSESVVKSNDESQKARPLR